MAPRLPRAFPAPRVKFAAAAAAGARNNEGIFWSRASFWLRFGSEAADAESNEGGLAPPRWKNGGKFGLIDDIRWSEGVNPPLLGVLLRSSKNRVSKTPVQIDVGLNSLQRQTIDSRPDHRISSICPNSGVVFQQARLTKGGMAAMRMADVKPSTVKGAPEEREAGKPG